MTIGILAVQGAFLEHEQMLSRLGASCFEIRRKSDLSQPMDGLILPGGESTAQGKLLRDLGMLGPLQEQIEKGLPVFGTCAGLLLLAKEIQNDTRRHLATMDMVAVRNAYGRQLGSFSAEAAFDGLGTVPMTFIRAPYIESVGAGVRVLSVVEGRIVAARQGSQLVTAFHPELCGDPRVHRYFLDMVRARQGVCCHGTSSTFEKSEQGCYPC